MNKFSFIKFPNNLTSYEFYNNILKQLSNHFSNSPTSKIVFDFSSINFINPLVLPNLLIAGRLVKNFYKEPVEILMPWKPKILSYLHDTGFLRVNDKEGIFSIDEGLIGGFDTGIYQETALYHFSKYEICEKSDITLSLKNSIGIIERAFREQQEDNENKIDKILLIFEEIVWNALTHGEGECFVCFQTNLGRSTSYKKAYISFSDGGVGFLRSMLSKLDKGDEQVKFLSSASIVSNAPFSHLAAILDAIFYRHNKDVFGLHDIIKLVSREQGTARIHTENTQLILTPNSLPDDPEDMDILQYFVASQDRNSLKDPKYANVRISKEKLHGAHYEFEIPLGVEVHQ